MMNDILCIKELNVYYGNKQILNNINIEIKKNKITSIIGPSGCGKSTLLKAINGMVREEETSYIEGEILLNGKNTKEISEEELRKKIGIVFQNPSPFPFSIYKNMTYAPLYHGVKNKKELKEKVEEKLSIAGLYDEVLDNLDMLATKLSGGQQQRLCIARALIVEPEILLLDEPCSALDIKNTQKIEEMLKKLSEKYTIIIVTHNLSQAKRISDYTGFLLNGELVEYGTAKDIFELPRDVRTKEYIEGIYG